ncbi:MAG: hypothetical protein PHY09_06265 [Desulfuromonadaceae bacterium]|nr:hypothetical protein [Desulfuromonadaceae bacterium]MDD5107108.1 hypothetical protein [Desulfuromonadaceae bacterium]
MASLEIPDMTQAQSVNFSVESGSSQKGDNGVGASSAVAAPARKNPPVSGDTVTISAQSQQAEAVSMQRDERIDKKDGENSNNAVKNNGNAVSAPSVEFIYDQQGELIVKYMDNAKKLIYQVPSQLMLRMREYAPKSDLSVDLKI